MSHKLIAVVLLATAMYATGVRADDPDTPTFFFSGFGTLGVVHSSESKADFTSSIFKPGGAGYTRRWSADVDSRLGGQVTANFGSQLSVVVQAISEQNDDNTYTPKVEWANIKYALTPDLSVRAGRIVLPSFLVADYRKVGYANPWVRPPLEVYNLGPVTRNDGVDASYRLRFDDFTSTLQATYGSKREARNTWGIFDTTELGPLTLHIAYLQTRLTIVALHPFFDAFRQFGPGGIAIADRYDCNGKPISLANFGASYDPGEWFLVGEWARSTSHCFLGASDGWYVSSGYKLGKFTPYLTYAQASARSNTSDPGLTLSTLPPFLAGPAAGLNAGLNAILGSVSVQKTVSVGGRWDFATNAALKLQFDLVRLGTGSPGTLINVQPAFQPGGRVNVFSATIDFVF